MQFQRCYLEDEIMMNRWVICSVFFFLIIRFITGTYIYIYIQHSKYLKGEIIGGLFRKQLNKFLTVECEDTHQL